MEEALEEAMTEPRSAEEWARFCWMAEHVKAVNPDVIVSLQVSVLCVACAAAYAAQQTAALREQNERLGVDVKIAVEDAKTSHAEVERLRLGMAHIGTCQDFANEREALVAVAKAAQAIVWDKDDEEGLHYCSVAEAHHLMDALAHPAVQRAVKEER